MSELLAFFSWEIPSFVGYLAAYAKKWREGKAV
jgi:hypothetical protein